MYEYVRQFSGGPFTTQSSCDDAMRAFSMLKASAEQLESVNENLNREILNVKSTYELQLNHTKAQSDKAELINVNLAQQYNKLAHQLENDRRYAYELDCSYRELVRQMDNEHAHLNQENQRLRQEVEKLQKDIVQFNLTLQDHSGQRSFMENNFRQQLGNRDSHIQELFTQNNKLLGQIRELASKLKKQEDEITYLYRSLEDYTQAEVKATLAASVAGETRPGHGREGRRNERNRSNNAAVRDSRDAFEVSFFSRKPAISFHIESQKFQLWLLSASFSFT